MKRESTEKLEQIFRAFDEKRIGKVPTKIAVNLI
jgi:Ca2+-binding EF-hand superfamily protein